MSEDAPAAETETADALLRDTESDNTDADSADSAKLMKGLINMKIRAGRYELKPTYTQFHRVFPILDTLSRDLFNLVIIYLLIRA